MPGFDGTGPEGKGPKTGRQMGKCEGAQPVERNYGRGVGRSSGNQRFPGLASQGFRRRIIQETK